VDLATGITEISESFLSGLRELPGYCPKAPRSWLLREVPGGRSKGSFREFFWTFRIKNGMIPDNTVKIHLIFC
jgi:hypothetical protein